MRQELGRMLGAVSVVAALAACGQDQMSVLDMPEAPQIAVVQSTPVLKLKIDYDWQSFRQRGDYIVKLAGDSFAARAGGYDLGRFPASFLMTDNSGIVRVYDTAGVRVIRLQQGSTWHRIRNVGDRFAIIENTTTPWVVEVNGTAYPMSLERDNNGNARVATCADAPECPQNRPYDARVFRIASAHPQTNGGYVTLDTLGDIISPIGYTGSIFAGLCKEVPDTFYTWRAWEAGPNLGSGREYDWVAGTGPTGTPNYWSFTPATYDWWEGHCRTAWGDDAGVLGGNYNRYQQALGRIELTVGTGAGVKWVIRGNGPWETAYFGYIMARECAADSTIVWWIADTTGALHKTKGTDSLRADLGNFRYALEDYRPQCNPGDIAW